MWTVEDSCGVCGGGCSRLCVCAGVCVFLSLLEARRAAEGGGGARGLENFTASSWRNFHPGEISASCRSRVGTFVVQLCPSARGTGPVLIAGTISGVQHG